MKTFEHEDSFLLSLLNEIMAVVLFVVQKHHCFQKLLKKSRSSFKKAVFFKIIDLIMYCYF